MASAHRDDKKLLLATAKEVVWRLRGKTAETCLRIRRPGKTHPLHSDGWATRIGDVGTSKPALEIWFDKYTVHPVRKFWIGFHSREAKAIRVLADKISEQGPIRELTDSDVDMEDAGAKLKQSLSASGFNVPVLETYKIWGHYYFGLYHPTSGTEATVNGQFCERAIAFVLDAVRVLPPPASEDSQGKLYPHCENRKWVAAHLSRERSRLLAADCKIRDGYQCQVCGMKFADVYGDELGADFAEAHHIKPLGSLPDKVKSVRDDLITVCANCHRMLHRMDGESDDIKKLKAIVLQHKANHD